MFDFGGFKASKLKPRKFPFTILCYLLVKTTRQRPAAFAWSFNWIETTLVFFTDENFRVDSTWVGDILDWEVPNCDHFQASRQHFAPSGRIFSRDRMMHPIGCTNRRGWFLCFYGVLCFLACLPAQSESSYHPLCHATSSPVFRRERVGRRLQFSTLVPFSFDKQSQTLDLFDSPQLYCRQNCNPIVTCQSP